jgi:hypothetical protein
VIDVFTEEIEVTIKDGIANLYWYRGDLKKCWLRAGIARDLADRIHTEQTVDGRAISKRQMMDRLYEELRCETHNRRLEISRNLVRVLVEQQTFVPQSENHRIEVAERCSLKLREIIQTQKTEREYREEIQRKAREAKKQDYHSQLSKIRERFVSAMELPEQKRGYSLETLFADLMQASGIPVERAFKVEGEQLDGALKYDGRYYLVELRWRKDKAAPADIGAFHFKVEGKFDERGIFISMNGYESSVQRVVPKGRAVKILLFDGNHLSNVISGLYTFQELMEHSISRAATRGEIYCSHDLAESSAT